MKYELVDKKLTLFFEGEINSYNAENVEKEAEDEIKGKEFSSLILNFAQLVYISSAGLRIILKLKQKYGDVSIVEASLEVYDVLSMTGFINMMPVKKALKRVYISGAQVVGEGFFSTVYRIDKDTIIKVFNRVSDPAQIERELSLAKQAFILGVPTAISYDIVRVDDKLGVRFEMLDCKSLKNTFLDNPDKYQEYVDKYVALLKKINTTECFNPEIPSAKKFYQKKVEVIKDFLEEKYYLKAKKVIDDLEDSHTFVHGDCHFKNIMVQGEDFLLIDMDTLSVGEPIFELAGIRAPYIAFEEDDPGNNEKFLGITKEFAIQLFDDILKGYFGKLDEEIKEKIALVCYIHMLYWYRINKPEDQIKFNNCKERLEKLLDKYDNVRIG